MPKNMRCNKGYNSRELIKKFYLDVTDIYNKSIIASDIYNMICKYLKILDYENYTAKQMFVNITE